MSTSKAMDFPSESYLKPELLATIDLNIEGTLSEAPEEDGSKSVEKSDPVTPLPLSVKVSESNSLPANQELDPAHEADNPDEAGLQTLTLAMEMIKSPAESQPRKRRRAWTSLKLGKIEKEDRPEWLPPEWDMERRARGTGSSAGMIDTFYYDPAGRQFRSKSEVIFYLDTGKRRSRKSKPKDNLDLANVMPLNSAGPSEQNGSTSKRTNNSGPSDQSGSTSKRKKRTGSNGNTNPPEKVRWAISFDADGSGSFDPVIGDETVPEQAREDLDPSFAFLTEGSASSPKVDAE